MLTSVQYFCVQASSHYCRNLLYIYVYKLIYMYKIADLPKNHKIQSSITTAIKLSKWHTKGGAMLIQNCQPVTSYRTNRLLILNFWQQISRAVDAHLWLAARDYSFEYFCAHTLQYLRACHKSATVAALWQQFMASVMAVVIRFSGKLQIVIVKCYDRCNTAFNPQNTYAISWHRLPTGVVTTLIGDKVGTNFQWLPPFLGGPATQWK
jgi:hypothetical protein